jgi:peptidoglycan/xylan/chitin deacetylase (PgdA/CDA1 family)
MTVRQKAVTAITVLLVAVFATAGYLAFGRHHDALAGGQGGSFVPVGVPTSASPSQSPSPSPSDPPSPSPSPSTAPPSPTPSRTSKKPAPPSTPPRQQCQACHGPAGSQSVTGDANVALTFDDGPDPTLTPQILALLRQYHVKATFCVIGSRARDYPDIVRQIAADGHSLCNHSWQHLLNLGQRDVGYQTWDLTQTNQAIQNAVPGAQIKWFRAPGGNFTNGLVSLARSLGMGSLYWDVDPRDWDSATYGTGQSMVNHIVSVVESHVRPGSIILSHDRGHPDTPTAYRILIPWLLERYTLVSL